jgi:transcriptional regulator with XRE-family HTH domain
MAGRATEWGAKLAELRRATGLSAAAVARDLGELGVALDRASIYAYEAGRVAAPDAAVVWGLARIYGVKLEDLVNALVDERAISRLVSSNRPPKLRPSRAELHVLERLRQLSPTARKACLDFIDFQLRPSPPRRGPKRRPPERGGKRR